MVEEGRLKMLRERKFTELKTADEKKALLEKSFPKSTPYVTNWSFNIFSQWQNARLNKQYPPRNFIMAEINLYS